MNVHRENEKKQSEKKLVLEAQKHCNKFSLQTACSSENPNCQQKGIRTKSRGN